jgi:hypothetical protein
VCDKSNVVVVREHRRAQREEDFQGRVWFPLRLRSAAPTSQEKRRVIWVTHSSIKINHRIVCTTSRDPGINNLATILNGPGSSHGGKSTTINLEASSTRSKKVNGYPGLVTVQVEADEIMSGRSDCQKRRTGTSLCLRIKESISRSRSRTVLYIHV